MYDKIIENEMNKIIEKLEDYVNTIPAEFRKINEYDVNLKQYPDRWSKKEILGHLIDSAFNNLQRLIRVQYQPEVKIVYSQNEWVDIQDYQNLDTDSTIQLWIVLNRQLIRIIRNFPADKLESKIDIGKTVPELHIAEFLITDYLSHMEHHFGQIFGRIY